MFTRRQLLILGGLAAAAIGVAGCSNNGGSGQTGDTYELFGSTSPIDLPLESASGAGSASRGTADLGWALISTHTEPNKVIAPSSLAITLGMLAEGATGETLAAIDSVFGLSGDERSKALGALRQSLKKYDSLPESVDVKAPPKEPVVHQASQVVVVEGKKVEQHFLDRLSTYFGAGAHQVPIDKVKGVLDAWAKKHTAGLIKQSAIQVTPRLVLVLQDAILFAAAWATEFTNDDRPLEFRAPGGTQQIKALFGEFSVPWAEGDSWTAVRLPYDEALAMDVILPTDGTDPNELSTEQLDAARLALDAASPHSVNLTMPPCDLTGKLKLLEMLEAQGITLDNVDGIFPGAVVEQFVQQVRFMVSAKGTVGAALTEVAVRESAPFPPPKVISMVVNRPFIMRVLDTSTGWPLFLTVISDAQAARGPN